MYDGMYYVYSLIHEGNVFYIGKTKDMITRYKSHLNSHKDALCAPVGKYIKSLLDNGNYPKMIMLFYLPTKEAAKKEAELINTLTSTGHKLYNCTNVSYVLNACNKLPEKMGKENVLRYLKYLTQRAEYNYAWENDLPEMDELPYEPFPLFTEYSNNEQANSNR